MSEKKHVELSGPSPFSAMSDEDRTRADIIRNTPCNQDPVIYWHQVAQDAIKSAEKAQERAKYATEGRDKAERELKYFQERLVSSAASQKSTLPLDISRLVDLASIGNIDLGIHISITKGSVEREE